MGIFDRFKTGASVTHGATRNAVTGFGTKASGPVGKAIGSAAEITGKGVGAVTGTTAAMLSPLKKPVKAGLITGGVIAGVVALGAIANSWRRNRAKESKAEIDQVAAQQTNDIPPLMTAQDVMAQGPQTMMGMQPVVGEHASRVMAGRGMAPQVAGAGQPNMTVVPEDSVQNLSPNRG